MSKSKYQALPAHAEPPLTIHISAASAIGPAGATAGGRRAPPVPLSALHRQRVAVHCQIKGQEMTILGQGVFELDPDLGPVLRIDAPDAADFQILIAERAWDGVIIADANRDWDFLIRLFR